MHEKASPERSPARRPRSSAIRLIEVLTVTAIVAGALVALAALGLGDGRNYAARCCGS